MSIYRRCLIYWLAVGYLLCARVVQASDSVETPAPGFWQEHIFHWYYNPRHHPIWLSDEAALALVIEAAKQWEVCGIQMVFQGETTRPAGQMDRSNVMGWSLTMPSQLRGITLGKARLGLLLERDVAIRPDRLEFQRYPRLLQKVITHEFGHAIGLTHSSRCDDVMTLAADCPSIDPEKLPLTLTEHDLERCKQLYIVDNLID